MTENKPMSESLQVGIVLALDGGTLDAYTFLCRGGVFATGETGNLVLLGLSLARGDMQPLSITFFRFSHLQWECLMQWD